MFSFKLIALFLLLFGAPVLIGFGYAAYIAPPPGSSGSSSSSGSVLTFSSSSSSSTLTFQNAPPVLVSRGVPGPIVGAGLPVLALGYGVYWLVRRRRLAVAPQGQHEA